MPPLQPGPAQHDPEPLLFGAQDAWLFGWYHPPSEAHRRSCGVVICNPIGDDYVRAHRTLRHLAERLAGAGFPTLRFDFHGTGDSSGDERDSGRVRRWLADVDAATDELRAVSGVGEVALVGLRLGATLAMAAAARREVGGLVLWSPYLDGRAFVAETTKLHRMHRMLEPQSFAAGPADNPDGQEALGFLLTHALVEELGGLDLRAERTRPARRALILSPGTAAGEERLLAHLQSLGTESALRHVAGPKFLTMTPHRSTLPDEELDVVVAWLAQHHPERAALDTPAPPARAGTGTARAPERPIRFGGQRRLFGVLVQPPPQARRPGLPAIVLLNAGTVHRIGPHRHSVGLARRWAGLGFSVLRVDLSGIGDSPVAAGCEENLCYPRDYMKDLDEVMDMLSAEIGAARFILVGLCSGGDIAFKRGVADRRVAGVVMMNPRTFCVNDLELVAAYQQARYYQGSLARREKWLKLLRGEVDLRRAVRLVLPKARDLALGAVRRVLAPARPRAAAGDQPDVPGSLRLMAQRGVDTFLLVTEHDPGVDYVDAHHGREMRALAAVPGFRREDVAGTDHTFTSLWAQQHVSDLISQHLARRYLS